MTTGFPRDLTFTRGPLTFPSALSALVANMRSTVPITPQLGTQPATATQLSALCALDATTTEEHAAQAVARSALASHEGPSQPPFPLPPLPRDQETTLAGLTASHHYLPLSAARAFDLTADDVSGRRSVLVFLWEAAAGFEAHCVGTRQVSTRPYHVTDRCDGTRETPALYTLMHCLHQLGWTFDAFQALYARAYAWDTPEGRTFDAPLEWYSATWRAHNTDVPPVSAAVLRDLCTSLYDMNFRSLAETVEREVLPHVSGT